MLNSKQLKRLRGAIGLIAAYALALQMLFGGIVATQMAVGAGADSFLNCSTVDNPTTDNGAKGGAKLGHGFCAVCAFASLSPPLPEAATKVFFGILSGSRPVLSPWVSHYIRRTHDPRSSQGPPQAV